MRILLTCTNCKHRYDASKIEIGARVRCHCGEVMVVQQPKSRESAIVRCSNCGAPRGKGSRSCDFCDADFTIHEQDLATVCANCMARVSDRARFCNHCGDPLSAETLVGEMGNLPCPQCGDKSKLRSRQLGKQQVSASECQLCAGLWVGHDSFKRLRQRAVKAAAHLENVMTSPPKPANLLRQTERAHRPCARCGNIMNRQQYARGSGVVIDICRDHGIWFDARELHQVIDWISRGGHIHQQTPEKPAPPPTSNSRERREAYQSLHRAPDNQPSLDFPWNSSRPTFQDQGQDVLSSVLKGLIEIVERSIND